MREEGSGLDGWSHATGLELTEEQPSFIIKDSKGKVGILPTNITE